MAEQDNISLYNLEMPTMGHIPKSVLPAIEGSKTIYANQSFETSAIGVIDELLTDLPSYFEDLQKIANKEKTNKLADAKWRAKNKDDLILAGMDAYGRAMQRGVDVVTPQVNTMLSGQGDWVMSENDVMTRTPDAPFDDRDGDGIRDLLDTDTKITHPADTNRDGTVDWFELSAWIQKIGVPSYDR